MTRASGQLLALHFNFYMQILYVMFAAGIYLLFINKKTNIETCSCRLCCWEASAITCCLRRNRSTFCTYIPLLVPTAAYAMNMFCSASMQR